MFTRQLLGPDLCLMFLYVTMSRLCTKLMFYHARIVIIFFVKEGITIPKYRPKPRFTLSKCLDRLNLGDFSISLLHAEWSPVFSCACVADKWTAFLQFFLPILDFNAPLKRKAH